MAQELDVQINPLVNYNQQIKIIKKECDAAGFPPECKEKLKSLHKEVDKLRRYCARKPNDFRCDALERTNSERVDPIEELCSRDPYASKCVSKREEKRRNVIQLARYCKIRPESSRCKPKPPPRKREPFMVGYCRNNPETKMCVRYLEQERERKDPNYREGRVNTF